MASGDVNEIVLFDPHNAGPYGDGYLNPRRPNSYNRTLHGLVDAGGFAPMFEGTEANLQTSTARDIKTAVEWEDASGNPTILLLSELLITGDPVLQRIDSTGVSTTERTFTAKTLGAIPGTLHSNGGSTPYFYACFNTTGLIEYRTIAAGWGSSAGTPQTADGLFSENGNLWAVLTNGYQVRKWPAGVNPVSGTAGAAVDIGNSAYRVTGAGLLARSYQVFVKPDGIYIYDIDSNRFENVWQDIPIHPDTGKGTKTWGGDVFVPLGWGGMVRVSQNTFRPEPASPLPRISNPGQDTPGHSRVVAMAADAQYLYASLEPFTKRITSLITKVFTSPDDLAFNDRTAVSTDDDRGTSFTLADFAATTGRLFVGCSARFGGAWLDVESAGISDSTFTMHYWNGSAWTSTDSIKDYTQALSYSGALFPISRIPTDWTTNAVNGTTAYWLRITFLGTAMNASTKIREVRVLPDPIALTGQSQISGHAAAGMATEILRGHVVGEEMVWDTFITQDFDFSRQLLFTKLKAQAGGRTFCAIGPDKYIRYSLGNSGRPQQEIYPNVTNSFSSELHLPADDRLKEGARAPTSVKGVEYIHIYGKNWEKGADLLSVYVSMDGGVPQLISSNVSSVPAKIPIPRHESPRGVEYAVSVTVKDTNQGERVPQVSHIVAGVYPLPDIDPENA